MKLCDSTTIPGMINVGLSNTHGEFVTIQSCGITSHPLRFIHQLHPFSYGDECHSDLEPKTVTICNVSGTTISPSTMCMRRSVIMKTGFMVDTPLCNESFDICLWEYLWRYIIIDENSRHKQISEKYRLLPKHNLNQTKSQQYMIEQILTNKLPFIECMDLCVTHSASVVFTGVHGYQKDSDSDSDSTDMTYTGLFSRAPEPIFEIGGLYVRRRISCYDRFMNILSYGDDRVHERVTVVYVVTTKNRMMYSRCLEQFRTAFMVPECSLIVCVTPDASMEWVKQASPKVGIIDESITYIDVKNPSDAFSTVFSKDYIRTPYTFMFTDTDLFKKERVLHPLCYILDVLDSSNGTWNSIRFTSKHQNGPQSQSQSQQHQEHSSNTNHPQCVSTYGIQMHQTNVFTDEPVLIRTRIASLFLQPNIDPLVGCGIGISNQLYIKYVSETIREKLKMGVYGRVGYPWCCENLEE